MDPIRLFDLASQQSRWLAARQATLAENIANANTPGYRAKDVQPFAEVLNQTQLQMAATRGGHLGADTTNPKGAVTKKEIEWEVTESGNSVSLEQELMKAGDVNRAYSLNVGIVKAFHGMLMSSVKE